jgi:PAS domain S-box-containing protein
MSFPSDSGTSRLRAAEGAGTITAVAEALFDELTRQAADACGVAIAAVSILEDGRHWYRSRGEVSAADTPRALLLCSEALRSDGGVTRSDLRKDGRFTEFIPGGMRFFAGVPIVTARAGAIGTLSVMDPSPKESFEGVLEELRRLAREAGRQFDIRLGAEEVLAGAPRPSRPGPVPAEPEFRQLVERSPVGTYVIQSERYRYANPKLGEILGYEPSELAGAEVAPFVVEADRAGVLSRIRGIATGAEAASYAFRAIRKDGEIVDVEVHESASDLEGRAALIGTMVDITDRKRAEAQAAERAFVDPLTRLPNRVRFL